MFCLDQLAVGCYCCSCSAEGGWKIFKLSRNQTDSLVVETIGALSNRPQVSMGYRQKADKPRGMLVEHEKNL